MPDVAGRVVATEAKRVLAPLGLVRKGRSRSWIDDHGWWLVNVEFQPSGYARGCYLNVGVQHLWVVRSYLCFEEAERPLGGSHFVAFESDESAFSEAMQSVATAAASAVARRRVEHGEGVAALQRIAAAGDDLNGGIALALLGDVEKARQRLTGRVHQEFRDSASGYLGLDAASARDRAWNQVQEARTALRLTATKQPSWDA